MRRGLVGVSIACCCWLAAACEQEAEGPKVPPDQSRLRKATDVFWALQELGFAVVKESPQKTQHGCKPFEYLAQKGAGDDIVSRFRISVFDCPTAQKAAEIVQHPHTRHVDDLLRNHHEGGVLRRRSLEIVVRMERGSPQEAEALMEALGAM
jgi:hypothetical protein